ncbi:MAG: hypothetical protein M1838_000503 [Thelocarpon superellum]|nr:MAG: hypothetical protein M1838_000503 [Thelocarpon superellum]
MSNVNSTPAVLFGTINRTHTSNITIYYPEGNLPTPWPLLTASILLSLLLGFIGFRSACVSWTPDIKRIKVTGIRSWKARAQANIDQRNELQQRAQAEAEMEALNGTKGGTEHAQEHLPERYLMEGPDRTLGPFARIRIMVAFLWTSFRVFLALALAIKVAATGRGTHAAPSSLLILLISVQTFLASRAMPRIMNFVLLIDTVFASTAFLISSFDTRHGTAYYGKYAFEGGNCALFASDCGTQYTRWRAVGCANYKSYSQDASNYNRYVPHGISDDFNFDLNVLHQSEVAISILGCIWLVTVLGTVYGCRHLLGSKVTEWFQPVERSIQRSHMGLALLASFLGLCFAVVIGITSIVTHYKQATTSHYATFLDGFGPVGPVNLTESATGHISSAYWGDENHWSDCFNATHPLNHNGFWDLWLASNADSIVRSVAGF